MQVIHDTLSSLGFGNPQAFSNLTLYPRPLPDPRWRVIPNVTVEVGL